MIDLYPDIWLGFAKPRADFCRVLYLKIYNLITYQTVNLEILLKVLTLESLIRTSKRTKKGKIQTGIKVIELKINLLTLGNTQLGTSLLHKYTTVCLLLWGFIY